MFCRKNIVTSTINRWILRSRQQQNCCSRQQSNHNLAKHWQISQLNNRNLGKFCHNNFSSFALSLSSKTNTTSLTSLLSSSKLTTINTNSIRHNSSNDNEANFRIVTGPNSNSSSSSSEKTKPKSAPSIRVVFVYDDGRRLEVKGRVGDTLLDVVIDNDIDLDGFGACEGTLACSTCHLILSEADYERIPNKPSDEEMDMLDLAYDLTDTSRLGCQIYLTKEFDGLEVKVPETINDARSS